MISQVVHAAHDCHNAVWILQQATPRHWRNHFKVCGKYWNDPVFKQVHSLLASAFLLRERLIQQTARLPSVGRRHQRLCSSKK